MTVQCPHCATGYLLPDDLLGPRGARVRCPGCGKAFMVHREGDVVGLDEPAGGAADPAPAAGAPESPQAAAADVLDRLESRLGPRIAEARARGRLLAEFGPELMRAFDEYRRRAGESAPAETFRRALRERWSVDLGSGGPAGA